MQSKQEPSDIKNALAGIRNLAGPKPCQAEEWLTTAEAASYLRVGSKRLLNLCSNGRIPHYKLGRSNRFLKSELRELLLSQRRGVLYGD